jgi:hypothetical protein
VGPHSIITLLALEQYKKLLGVGKWKQLIIKRLLSFKITFCLTCLLS